MDVTKCLVKAGKIMNIPVIDHIIVAGGTAEYFSFHDTHQEMFTIKEAAEYPVHEQQTKLDSDQLMVRPACRNYGVYRDVSFQQTLVSACN